MQRFMRQKEHGLPHGELGTEGRVIQNFPLAIHCRRRHLIRRTHRMPQKY